MIGSDIVRVALIGNGVIGRVHRSIIDAHPRFELSAIADPQLPDSRDDLPSTVSAFADLDDLIAAVEGGVTSPVDLFVLATPTKDHVAHATKVLERTSSWVLSEKPLSHVPGAVADLVAHDDRWASRLRMVNHFAFSPEVEWAAGEARRRGLGAPQRLVSVFNDPYGKFSVRQRSTYVSSWVDSGPNQLAVLLRFAGMQSEPTVIHHHEEGDGSHARTVLVHHGGRSTFSSNWRTGASSKQTVVSWSAGIEIIVDHTAMAALLMTDGHPDLHFTYEGPWDRKSAHYYSMYEALVTQPAHECFGVELAALTERVLSSAGR